jgi:hypothetical protein
MLGIRSVVEGDALRRSSCMLPEVAGLWSVNRDPSGMLATKSIQQFALLGLKTAAYRPITIRWRVWMR